MNTMRTSPRAALAVDFAAIAERVAAGGMAALGADLAVVAAAARRAGASDVLVETLLDHNAPEVARQRAFGRLAVTVATAREALRPAA